jgi:hypothetical protein
MSLTKEVQTNIKLYDTEGQVLEFGDKVIYQTRTEKDTIAILKGFEKGMVKLKNVTDDKEYRLRMDTFNKIERVDK